MCHLWFNWNFMKLWEYFLCTKKTKITLFNNFFSSVSLWLNHRCHMDYFIDVLTTFLGLERGSWVDLYGGSESSWISFEFVFWRWTKVLWVWKDFIFGWIIPLKPQLFASTVDWANAEAPILLWLMTVFLHLPVKTVRQTSYHVINICEQKSKSFNVTEVL